MVSNFKTVQDNMPELFHALEELKKTDVLVGIPERESSRETDDINNAELLYIHTHGIRKSEMRKEMQENVDNGSPYSEAYQMYIQEHGSPLWHSPPRPVLEPAIADKKEQIAEQLSKAMTSLLDGNSQETTICLHKAGQVAENSARDWFINPKNGWAPNSQKTIERKGSEQPLIDTGSMRKAITHVVRSKGAETND